jgi:hypothetical protein
MSVEQRLSRSRLERQNRWLKRLGALAIAVGAVVVLVGQGKGKPQILQGKKLVLEDEAGTARVVIEHVVKPKERFVRPYFVLKFLDAQAHEQIQLACGDEGSTSLRFGEPDGDVVLHRGGILFFGDRHSARLGTKRLTLFKSGRPWERRETFIEAGQLHVKAPEFGGEVAIATGKGSAGIRVRDKNGDVLWKAPGE